MNRMHWIAVAAIIWIAIGSGCAARHGEPPVAEVLRVPPYVPLRPVLPRLSADDLSCLSDDVYRRLVTRQRLRREYAEQLEAILGVAR